MKTILYSAPFKFFLTLITALALFFSCTTLLLSVALDLSGADRENYRAPVEQTLRYRTEDRLCTALQHYRVQGKDAAEKLFSDDFSLRIEEIADGTTDPFVPVAGIELPCAHTVYFVERYNSAGEPDRTEFWNESTASRNKNNGNYKATLRVTGSFTEQSEEIQALRQQQKAIGFLLEQKTNLFVTGLILLPLFLGGCVFLCRIAGKRKNTEGIAVSFMDRMPFELLLSAEVAGIAGIFMMVDLAAKSDFILPTAAWIFLVGAAGLGCLYSVWLLYTTSVRIKAKILLRSTALYWIFRRIGMGLRRVFSALSNLFGKIPTVPKTAAVLAALTAVNIFLGLFSRSAGVLFLLILEWLILSAAVLLISSGFSLLQKKAKEMAQGNLTETEAPKGLIGPMKEYAEDLNRIGDGLNRAVNERIKSERMKTELIANVSHDIKTPLTSIINYTDLLSKEEQTEKGREYLEILHRQSNRLKKLTDDVVEASKASSGAITIDLAPCDLKILLEQTAGEYREKTDAKGLTVLLRLPDEPVVISADGRRLWRIFENLMNNVCKYALPGTRVYLDLTEEDGMARITFRNVSEQPLNHSPEELTERFVRGDSSRNTEGSGLGLAIARSLTELQNGKFKITVDGDLFKVTVSFPTLKK